jgi:3,5-dihydroxyphenylacetyl-CoA synthase
MFIGGVGTAVPPQRYTQKECWDAFCKSPYLERLNSRSQAILRKVLTGDSGIETRNFVMRDLSEAFALEPNLLHARFAENAPGLAAEAGRKALRNAGIRNEEIDALLICTCTGYLCPGLTSYVSELLGLRGDALLFDLVGQGCGAALPALNMGHALLHSGQASRVLVVAVEICTAAFYVDNDPGVLISNCLFGDGAGAVVLQKERPGGRSIEWKHYKSNLNPKDRDLLRFELHNGMLRNVLDKSVPVLVVEQLRVVLEQLEVASAVRKADIRGWILHAGGRDVLLAIQTGLQVPAEQLRWSAEVLRENGNVSSPCAIFALEKALGANAPGGTWLLSAFGAGITCHGALLDVQ